MSCVDFIGFLLYIIVFVFLMIAWVMGLYKIYRRRKTVRFCVMCHRKLLPEHESKKWKGAHEWCEDCG